MHSFSFRAAAAAAVAAASVAAAHAADTARDAADQLEEIVITASPIPDAQYLATIVSIVNREQILREGGANLVDALANEPGITGTSFASGASRPVIRGFDANRVRVLEDGIGSFDVSDVGPDHGVPIDPLSAQKVEVVRGAATLRYGSQAIGGVVNAINNRVPTTLPDKPLGGEITGTYGSAATAAEGAALFDARAGQFALHADGFDRATADYGVPGGTQANSFFHGDGYALGSSYFVGDSHVGAAVVHYDARYGIPSDTTYIDMQQTKEMVRSVFAVNAGGLKSLSVDGGHAAYQHDERDPDGTALSTFRDNEWDIRTEGLFGTIGPLDGAALGVQVQQRQFSALGEGQSYLLPTTTRAAAGFAFAEIPFSSTWRLQGGARVEQVRMDGTPASGMHITRDFSPLSAAAGFVFDLTRTARFGLTFSSAARAPAQTELFARGPHDGPGTFETGDAGLRVERANSIEATIRAGGSDISFEGSVWAVKFNNYIYGALTGRSCDDDGACADAAGELKELNYRQSGAVFRGAEAKLTQPLVDSAGRKLTAELIGDYVRATLEDGGNVPRMPPWHVGARLHWEGPSIDSGLIVRYSGRQNEFAAAETPTAGFVSVDAHCGWRPFAEHRQLELIFAGRNLTNREQRNSVALNKDQVILPGRDLRFVLSATF